MTWAQRWRADLARPEVPTARSEAGFLTASALVFIVVAHLADPGSGFALAVLVAPLAAFVARGLVPRLPAELFAALVIVPVIVAVGQAGRLEVTLFLGVLVTLYTSWHLGSVSRAALIAAASAATPFALATWWTAAADIGWPAWTAANGFTFAMGRLLRRQQALIHQLEAAQQALADQAVAEERRRIARELHDLAGHTLAAMVLHVTGARHVLRRDVNEAEQALRDAEAVGRTGLDQIRTTVAALRTHERGTDPALGGVADLPDVVAAYRQGGLAIRATISPSAHAIDGAPGTALHRIAREALANVARHAPANHVELVLDVVDGQAALAVVDHGRAGTRPRPGPAHFGLVGMRERAQSLGGELEAGPTDDGWAVSARIPLAPPGAAPRPAPEPGAAAGAVGPVTGCAS